jgi:hypothetical protein
MCIWYQNWPLLSNAHNPNIHFIGEVFGFVFLLFSHRYIINVDNLVMYAFPCQALIFRMDQLQNNLVVSREVRNLGAPQNELSCV